MCVVAGVQMTNHPHPPRQQRRHVAAIEKEEFDHTR